jgi:hypothetical protein
MSSFVEAVCATFDDSRLGIVLDSERKRSELAPDLREIAIKLRYIVKKVPQGLSPLEEINHPAMQEVREIAEKMLVMLKT